MAGTIFEKSSTSLRLWYYAMYLMASTRCGISAKQIQRETGVTYKTAWRMFRQIRSLLSETDMQLEGAAVEMDETYVGGKRKGHAGVRCAAISKESPVIWDGGAQAESLLASRLMSRSRSLHGIGEGIRPAEESTVFTDEYSPMTGVGRTNGIRPSAHQSQCRGLRDGRRSHKHH